jgi:hypothetical protein
MEKETVAKRDSINWDLLGYHSSESFGNTFESECS